ncbi:aspartate/glutamate racemase family protein [Propionivibrio soli]|uniref:aspartate/glutamate racemase family protein n=1 Tax=Propionivibrio soli TaxID=2976531 RepID=UPI0021E85725
MSVKPSRRRIAVVSGLSVLGAADVFAKLMRALSACSPQELPEVLFEQDPVHAEKNRGATDLLPSGTKIHVFDSVRDLAGRDVDTVVLPCFLSQTFLNEIEGETTVRIVNAMDALRRHLETRYPGAKRLGILTSDYVRSQALFERAFPGEHWQLVYPRDAVQSDGVMAAVYGPRGIRAGCVEGAPVEQLNEACRDLAEQGAEVIVPGCTEIPLLLAALDAGGVPVVDSNAVYAEYAASSPAGHRRKPFKIGIVGGVGPAATVDFVDKIVRSTPATRDQDHIKVVVEQNPQIPDRTANLIGDGADPTIAIYATCKRLEADEADIITIPCNTAHAFVERIQPYLSIPVVNMLRETAQYIRNHYGNCRMIGLLATNGTVASRVYHEALAAAGFDVLVPDDANQRCVMNAIYGTKGVKAGYTTGECVDDLQQAMASLVMRGAEVLILGCTELPLLQEQNEAFSIAGKSVVVLDPTLILARKCVELSQA